MTFLLGPLVVLAFFGALEAASRLLGMPFSILGALGAVVRQTEEPRLQRRQALTMLLLVAGIILLGGGAFYLTAGFWTQTVLIASLVGGVLLSLAGNIGTRTLRAIGRSAKEKAATKEP